MSRRDVAPARETLLSIGLIGEGQHDGVGRTLCVPDELVGKLLAVERHPGVGPQLIAHIGQRTGLGLRWAALTQKPAKCHAAFAGKYSPDIENVRAVALPILRHRIVRNYKAEAEGITVERLVGELV